MGIVGSGWRAEFYIRIARVLKDRFDISGVVTTNAEKAKMFKSRYNVKIYSDCKEMLSHTKPDFVVVSISTAPGSDVASDIAVGGIPVLMETPPAGNMEQLISINRKCKNAKIQVAEQYHLQPVHSATLSFIKNGKMGNIRVANISFTQGHHAVSLVRKYLGIQYENTLITATRFNVSVTGGFIREGEPKSSEILTKSQVLACLQFEGKESEKRTGIIDFENDQHRSWIRTPLIKIKGDKGEIFNQNIKYLKDYLTPVDTAFIRKNMGERENLEGYGLKGIIADGDWYYKNPYLNFQMSDDEIAVAECMEKMAMYIACGESFYSLQEASQDLYLSIMIEAAAKSNTSVQTENQIWHK